MPYRFSTFLVSTLRIFPAFTDSIGISNLTGMVGEVFFYVGRTSNDCASQMECVGWLIGDKSGQAGMYPEAELLLEGPKNLFATSRKDECTK